MDRSTEPAAVPRRAAAAMRTELTPGCRLAIERRAIRRSAQVLGDRRLGLARSRSMPARLTRAAGDADPSRRPVGPGRQPGQDQGRRRLAARQRPHPARPATTRQASSRRRSTSSARATRTTRPASMTNFRRGVTRYPIPGAESIRSPTDDLKQIFAADERAAHRDRHRLPDQGHPRRALRRRHARQAFRAARLDRHRQVDLRRADPAPHLRPAPEGHIVMIDPHGEYSAAFKGNGELFNVDNLPCPTG